MTPTFLMCSCCVQYPTHLNNVSVTGVPGTCGQMFHRCVWCLVLGLSCITSMLCMDAETAHENITSRVDMGVFRGLWWTRIIIKGSQNCITDVGIVESNGDK